MTAADILLVLDRQAGELSSFFSAFKVASHAGIIFVGDDQSHGVKNRCWLLSLDSLFGATYDVSCTAVLYEETYGEYNASRLVFDVDLHGQHDDDYLILIVGVAVYLWVVGGGTENACWQYLKIA